MPAPESITALDAFLDPDREIEELKPVVSKYLSELLPTLKDSQIPIREGDGLRISDPELLARGSRIAVILDELRSVFNVGSIFRSSECLALGELALCGITPGPEHPNFEKTAMGTGDRVPWKRFTQSTEAIAHYRSRGYRILALETALEASSVFDFQPQLPLALVLGNESLGISAEVLAQCDGCLALPVLGWKNSLNVGVAFAVTAYQLVFQKVTSNE